MIFMNEELILLDLSIGDSRLIIVRLLQQINDQVNIRLCGKVFLHCVDKTFKGLHAYIALFLNFAYKICW